jgi:hypothetical protein
MIHIKNYLQHCKTGFHGGDYEEHSFLWYKKPVHSSQDTHYFFSAELCMIWGFHGGDYEEYRLLGYKTPALISQETHYFSASESSEIMLCKIWGFHNGDYEECRLLGYKFPVRTSQETLRLSYRIQLINAM